VRKSNHDSKVHQHNNQADAEWVETAKEKAMGIYPKRVI
jgi:hypothetical protein